jgi:hypothetical protein
VRFANTSNNIISIFRRVIMIHISQLHSFGIISYLSARAELHKRRSSLFVRCRITSSPSPSIVAAFTHRILCYFTLSSRITSKLKLPLSAVAVSELVAREPPLEASVYHAVPMGVRRAEDRVLKRLSNRVQDSDYHRTAVEKRKCQLLEFNWSFVNCLLCGLP